MSYALSSTNLRSAPLPFLTYCPVLTCICPTLLTYEVRYYQCEISMLLPTALLTYPPSKRPPVLPHALSGTDLRRGLLPAGNLGTPAYDPLRLRPLSCDAAPPFCPRTQAHPGLTLDPRP
eukprot:2692527-Rhodomonas_salina.1